MGRGEEWGSEWVHAPPSFAMIDPLITPRLFSPSSSSSSDDDTHTHARMHTHAHPPSHTHACTHGGSPASVRPSAHHSALTRLSLLFCHDFSGQPLVSFSCPRDDGGLLAHAAGQRNCGHRYDRGFTGAGYREREPADDWDDWDDVVACGVVVKHPLSPTSKQQTKLDYMFMFKKADMDIISMTMMVGWRWREREG